MGTILYAAYSEPDLICLLIPENSLSFGRPMTSTGCCVVENESGSGLPSNVKFFSSTGAATYHGLDSHTVTSLKSIGVELIFS